ncbi:DUF1464 family protein [Stygiolobus caldivivus]|uniref:Acetate kinase n=1 Tax=Stygiolobus caldivivus TaxID=2824673 RepID=A0A8D5U6B4_9CREN|nr:DUF1464 family protein [Stygiolobus caldivivus]BCU70420.1 acetate kinase [Stygiolobus caldivivus]
MIFSGVDPGSGTYEVAFVDETGRTLKLLSIPTDLVDKASSILVKYISDLRPIGVALPSGHGLPFKRSSEITDRDIFLMTLKDPAVEGPLRNFLVSARTLDNAFTLPGVIELISVDKSKKINLIDMGTADKVASAFFYRTMYDSFVLIEVGSSFSSLLVVVEGKVVDGLGGSIIPGISSAGFLDGEVAYLLSKYSKITKNTIYTNGNWERGLQLLRIIAEWYSAQYKIPIIVSGSKKWEIPFGIKHNFKFKESSVGSAFVANALFGGVFRDYLSFLESAGTPIDYVRLKGWEEVISLIRTF